MSAPDDLRDIELAAALTAALRLHDEFTGVIVDVADGVVILEGCVLDAAQRAAAETLVRNLDHVVHVQNALQLKSGA